MNSNIEPRFDRFFGEAGHLLRILRKFRRERDLYIAKEFNVFNYLDTNETKLSKIIADLLRPDGGHGQGVAFLAEFLQSLNILRDHSVWNELLTPSQLATAKIHVELCTASKRRMDIVVEIGICGILIESKAFGAGDQLNQLEDYVQEMRKRFNENFLVVYLSQDAGKPSPQSLSEEMSQTLAAANRLYVKECTEFVCGWVEACQKICKAEKVRYFLGDLIDFLKEIAPRAEGQTVMSDNDKDAVLEYALRDQENLEIALRVSAHFDDIRQKVLERFGEELKKKIATNLKLEWTIENRGMFERCEGVRISKPSWDNRYWIEIAPDKKGGQAIWFGINDPAKLLNGDAIKKEIDSKYQKGASGPGFPWYRYVERYRNLGDVDNLLKLNGKDPEMISELSKHLEELAPIAGAAIDKFSPR